MRIMEGSAKDSNKVTPCDHHTQAEFCTTRASYRQGKEFKAVKVYTINNESQHLLIQNVPSIGLFREVKRLASKHGKVDSIRLEKDYPVTTEFTHVYYVKYRFLRDARQAKKRLDNQSFFGNLLHICYAPELESVEECRRKLHERISSIQKNFSSRKSEGAQVTRTTNTGREIPASSTNEVGTWSNLLPSTASKIVSKSANPHHPAKLL